ncbi:putative C2H2 finger domain protein [Aspergillus affinis]|uniref:putative C2H2 finger domain protein n=1 Tax=Aspergillus affinis TaxID=1070780 RepID=UPI0022FDF9D5|nr:putative C2H2 finger domain protein [Aspergillus affinis]KAI9037860.1 putative C2H2 finger domain protein [Aspergillus affinis]
MAPTTPSKIRCTYRSCNLFFDSLIEMKRHKIVEAEHDYCRVCDEDFVDEEHLLIHKISSDKHIVCPICGMEYRSEGGRDGHIRQNHRSKQSITCHGCKERFTSASNMMRHIEENKCPVISQFVLLKEKSKKLMIKEALKEGEGSPMPLIPDPAEADDIDGGVKILSIESRRREAILSQPSLVKAGDSGYASAALATRHWSTLGGSSRSSELPSDIIDLTGLDISSNQENQPSWRVKGRVAPTEASVSEIRPFGIATPDAGQTLRLLDARWDPTNFLNSFSGEYVCPCGMKFSAQADFEEHVLCKSRSKNAVQCPRCLRKFKSTAALIAHCESPSTRCDINEGERYGQIIDELTGGVIQAVGYNDDGTVKYGAGRLDLPKTPKATTKW